MSKIVVEFASRRVTYETPLPIAEVIARLEREINTPAGGPEVFRLLRTSQTRTELEQGFGALIQDRDFVYFTHAAYHRWLDAYNNTPGAAPQTYVYTLGNPLIAQGMLRHDLAAALHVPPRLLVSENADGSGGTRVVYDDPASVLPVPSTAAPAVNEGLRSVAESLSRKLEDLVRAITRPLDVVED